MRSSLLNFWPNMKHCIFHHQMMLRNILRCSIVVWSALKNIFSTMPKYGCGYNMKLVLPNPTNASPKIQDGGQMMQPICAKDCINLARATKSILVGWQLSRVIWKAGTCPQSFHQKSKTAINHMTHLCWLLCKPCKDPKEYSGGIPAQPSHDVMQKMSCDTPTPTPLVTRHLMSHLDFGPANVPIFCIVWRKLFVCRNHTVSTISPSVRIYF